MTLTNSETLASWPKIKCFGALVSVDSDFSHCNRNCVAVHILEKALVNHLFSSKCTWDRHRGEANSAKEVTMGHFKDKQAICDVMGTSAAPSWPAMHSICDLQQNQAELFILGRRIQTNSRVPWPLLYGCIIYGTDLLKSYLHIALACWRTLRWVKLLSGVGMVLQQGKCVKVNRRMLKLRHNTWHFRSMDRCLSGPVKVSTPRCVTTKLEVAGTCNVSGVHMHARWYTSSAQHKSMFGLLCCGQKGK